MTDREILIDDLEGFRVIDNPLRQRILHICRNPKSVREIAETLGVPVTRLYYHINMLEEGGFLEVSEVRKAGAQLERIYQSLTGTVRPSPGFVENVGDAKKAAHVLAGVLFDITRVEVETVLEKQLTGIEGTGTVARSMGQMPLDLAEEFTKRIEALTEEMREVSREHNGGDAPVFSFTYAFVPTEME